MKRRGRKRKRKMKRRGRNRKKKMNRKRRRKRRGGNRKRKDLGDKEDKGERGEISDRLRKKGEAKWEIL